jgi:hypothetical protein
LTSPQPERLAVLAQIAPERRYHVWQTPESRIAPKPPRPAGPWRLPPWLGAALQRLLGQDFYARCRKMARGARPGP